MRILKAKFYAHTTVVILAGGFGTGVVEMKGMFPNPLVEIRRRSILWDVMNIYAYYGFSEFIIALGFKSESVEA